MGGFDRQSFTPARGEPDDESKLARLARPLLAVVVVVVLLYGGHKFLMSTNAGADAASSDAQMAQIAQRLDDLNQRLDQLEGEKKHRTPREVSELAAPIPAPVAAAPRPVSTQRQLGFSRSVNPQAVPSAPPANSLADPAARVSPAGGSPPPPDLSAVKADIASTQQQWVATADRLGTVVGELDSQRTVLERDQAKLDELAGRFARNSQPFTLERGANKQQVGPVWLRLQSTDLKNQRYSMSLSVDDRVVQLKDRALHEAVQFYAAGGKLSFELVVSQIGRDNVAGKLVLPQTTATR